METLTAPGSTRVYRAAKMSHILTEANHFSRFWQSHSQRALPFLAKGVFFLCAFEGEIQFSSEIYVCEV